MVDAAPSYDDEKVIAAPTPAIIALATPYLPLIQFHAEALVDDFYASLLQRTESHRYLNNSVVETRLKTELVSWLRHAFSVEALNDPAAFEQRQQQIGEFHARLRIPIHLVHIGALRLRTRISELVRDDVTQPWENCYDVMRFFDAWIDGAITAMSRSGIRRIVNRTRLEESYRLFSLDQDMNLERERQRASLLEWSQSTLLSVLHSHANNAPTDPLALAPFGLWVRHRAEVMFETAPQMAEIKQAVARVDDVLLPSLRSPDSGRQTSALQALGAEVDRILALLGDMFQGLSEVELGRDALTRTLNRRFLPSILLREIGFVSRTSMSLSGFMLDVDNFKNINSIHGHHTGDAVLRTLAGILSDNVRSTDFIFRYGGEEFFVLLVETQLHESVETAERVRRAVADADFRAGDTSINVTVSIGVATHNGHPDPDDLVKRADFALIEAKQEGRNRVVVSG
ncbi:GGDEF domain-containing protein [Mycobacterium sp. 236(2023)]|uniref:GGDEF domain-containing protein n=1 Tax=Mycobacterium sp. 236(2023) TaxID=3038163 RepID=UPI00241533A7|nr:GGDEF domain-containing protein [Mycobacterium sp. 236(2023)]MDG4664152.1 GGDEF domain-containing protein [Mycobacterium sp. 236(2023)]